MEKAQSSKPGAPVAQQAPAGAGAQKKTFSKKLK